MRLLLGAAFCIVFAEEFYDEHRAYDLGEQYAAAAQSRLVARFKEESAQAAQIPDTTDEGRARPTRPRGRTFGGRTFDVERRLQRTYAIRRGAAVFVQAVLLVRFQECDATGDDASLAVLKIATVKGSPRPPKTEAMVQWRVSLAVEGLVPRLFEAHEIDRSPHTTTWGMLMEYLHGYEQLDSLDELRPMHLIRTALCGNQPVRRVLH